MASTVTASTLNVTIKEDIDLNGQPYGSVNTLSIKNIKNIYKRIVSCPGAVDTTVATFQSGTNISDNALDLESTKYIRITNLDSASSIDLSLQIAQAEDGNASRSATVRIDGGRSFVMGSGHDGLGVSDANATIVDVLTDLESLIVNTGAGSASIDVEVFIAGE